MPGDQLSQIMELVIGTTKGHTDSQEVIADVSVQLTVLPNPPPVVINVSGINQGFLLPEFAVNTLEEYVACGMSNVKELNSINGFVYDRRFHVNETVGRSDNDCMGFQRKLKGFTVVRNNEPECSLYCEEYKPRHGYFDLAVSSSPSGIDCVKAAIKWNNKMVLSQFIEIMETGVMEKRMGMGWEIWKAIADSNCDVVQEAVLLDRFDMIQQFAESPHTNKTVLPCDGCKSTPLGVAARGHKNKALEQLLSLGVPVDVMDSQARTALFLASQNANIKAMELLIEKGADVNHLMTPYRANANEECGAETVALCYRRMATRAMPLLHSHKQGLMFSFPCPMCGVLPDFLL